MLGVHFLNVKLSSVALFPPPSRPHSLLSKGRSGEYGGVVHEARDVQGRCSGTWLRMNSRVLRGLRGRGSFADSPGGGGYTIRWVG